MFSQYEIWSGLYSVVKDKERHHLAYIVVSITEYSAVARVAVLKDGLVTDLLQVTFLKPCCMEIDLCEHRVISHLKYTH